jgi:hypothetical protein
METFPDIGNDVEAVKNKEIKTEETQCITQRQTKN